MDRVIKKKKWPFSKIILIVGACSIVILMAYLVFSRSGKTRLKVNPGRLTVSSIKSSEFLEYIPITGTVQPIKTVFLDIEEGGRVEEIFVDGGRPIQKGDLILRFSNAALQKESINAESLLLDNINQLRNTKISLAEKKLILKDNLLDIEYRIKDLERIYNHYKVLEEKGNISTDEFVETKDQLAYLKQKRELLKERISQEEVLRQQQLEQVDESIARVTRSLEIMGRIVDSLEVRAPISGHLSSLKAEIGESIRKGQRIGQIDVLDDFIVRAKIDQYYISKVGIGQTGHFDFNGSSHTLEIEKIYPEVINDVFEVDMVFKSHAPSGIKRGQSLQIDLSLSDPKTCLVVDKGGFYQQTGGQWIYLLSEDRLSAHKMNIRVGRQNPRYLEVLEGLKEGDWVITSGYDTFNKVDELQFTEPLIVY